MEKFNLKNQNNLEGNNQYQIKILDKFTAPENWDVDIKRLEEIIQNY
jgi:hypothetical protein